MSSSERVLSWNLGTKTQAKAGSTSAAAPSIAILEKEFNELGEPTIIMLQEAPVSRIQKVLSKYDIQSTPNGVVLALRKQSWQILSYHSPERYAERFAVVVAQRIVSGTNPPAARRFILASVHGVVLTNGTDERDQEQVCAYLRRCIDSIVVNNGWTGGYSVVIAGDFNTSPYSDAVSRDGYLYATRCGDPSARPIVQARTPLFNPMWQLYGRPDGKLGTYYRTANKRGDAPWRLFDQVIVSSDLAATIRVSVHKKIGNTDLCAPRTRAPSKEVASDHFPVSAEF